MLYIPDSLSLKKTWEISGQRFALLLALLNTLLFNVALYDYVASHLDVFTFSGLMIVASITLFVFTFNLFFISLLLMIAPALLKLMFIITAWVNAVALYYLLSYQVTLDITMIGNILNTRTSESVELLTPTLFIYAVLLAIIPSVFILKIKVEPLNRLKIIINSVIALVVTILFLYANASGWLWLDKHAKILGGKVLPWSYIVNTVRYYSHQAKSNKKQILLPTGKFTNKQKIAVVLIIGETARANNFSLYGYARETNPLLKSDDILVMNKTTACTTYTTGSVACMLSHDVKQSGYEPLPSYLHRMGAKVVWRSNNWGEPAIDVSTYQKGGDLAAQCQGEDCQFDGVLLTHLNDEITASDKDKVFIVLHTKGSHGPSYYSRYPSSFEKFTPVCRHEELSKCTSQELINAYDNTILYTDYFLHQTIAQLKQLNMPVMLIYASDHGESLGEEGLYLHGTPFMFAPKYQKEIPFIIWRSQALIQLQGVSNAAIKQTGEFSHADIFHTILGTFAVQSPIYNKTLDILNMQKQPITQATQTN